MLLGLGRAGEAAPVLAAPELNLTLLAALLLFGVSLLLLAGSPQPARISALASMASALLLLLRWDSTFSSAELLGNEVVGGASVLGRYAVGAWLLLSGLSSWLIAGRSAGALASGLVVAAAASMGAVAATVFSLSCLLIFGRLADSEALLSPTLLLGGLLLSLALVLSGWAQVARRSRSLPDETYRWQFGRYLALLLTTAALAGLGATALGARHAVGLLSQDLQERAKAQAIALELYTARHAAFVHALQGIAGFSEKTLTARALHEMAEQVDLAAAPPDTAWPVLRRTEYRASLLADSSVALEYLQGENAGRHIRLRPRQAPVFVMQRPDRDGNVLATTPLLCQPDHAGGLDCTHLRAEPRKHRPAHIDRLTISALASRPDGLVQISGSFDGHALAASVPLGDQGSLLLLQLDNANLLGMVGRPMLQGLGLLGLLTLLAAVWSYWRQLPWQRELHRRADLGDAAMHALPLALLLVDEAQQIVDANPAAQALLGSAHVLVGSPVMRVLPTWPGARAEAGAPLQMRCEARRADGSVLPVELVQQPTRLSGQTQQLLLLRDLSLEERNDAALYRWQQLFDAAGWGMALVSLEKPQRLELLNPAYARMLGYTTQELAGQPWSHCIAPAQWEPVQAMLADAAAGHVVQASLRHRRRDGSELPSLVSMSAVRDARGRAKDYIVSIQDISALERTQSEAIRRANHLSAVLEALPVGIWISDLEGQVQQANSKARLLWPGQSAGQPAGDGHESLMRRAAVTRSQISGELRELSQADGSSLSLLTTASPVIDATSGQVLGAIAIDEDLSQQQRSAAALREANELLERILQSCAVGIALTDAQGRLLRHNPAWTLLLGPPPPTELLEQLLEPGDALRQRDLLPCIGRGELPTYVGEHKLRRVTGAYGWTLLLASRLPGAPDQPARVLVQLMDIDERRRAGEEVLASQLRLTAAQRLARVGDWHWDRNGDFFVCSEQMLGMLGVSQLPLGRLGRANLLALVHADDRERLDRALRRAQAGQGHVDEDVRLLRGDGQTLIVQFQGLLQHTVGGPNMAGTLLDVTDRKRIESELRESREQLRELMSYEDQLIEDERKRIAREVHDELGQLLTALRMDLGMLRSQLPAESPAARQAVQMRETMVTMAEVVRHVASNLRPAALDLGLVAAIEWLAEDFSLRWETHVELQLPREQEPRLPEAVALALFRAVQESLTNVAKHARPSHVLISLRDTEGMLCLSVSDDGCGFDPAAVAARRRGGLGLLGMRERMHAIGASLEIHSGDGGTTVEIRYDTKHRQDHNQNL